MKRKALYLLLVGIVSLMLAVPVSAADPALSASDDAKGLVVVANRGSGSISVIDVATDQVVHTIPLPGDSPEPMYVVYVHPAHKVFVGDRANSQVAVYDSATFELAGVVPTGSGVFHMWADATGRQLWVNNDVDNTATVIDAKTLFVIATVPMPADLIAEGGKPHDVVLDPQGGSAFVTLLGFSGEHDYVVKFETGTFTEVARAAVGKDPHVSLTKRNNFLYVPAQNSDTVTVLDRDTLAYVTDIPVPGAHGAGMRDDGRVFYTTNLPGGGTGGLVAIDTASNSVIDSVDTPFPAPHNIAMTDKGEKIYVTHSGADAQTVTVYTASKKDPSPTYMAEITVGTNPFGVTYVP